MLSREGNCSERRNCDGMLHAVASGKQAEAETGSAENKQADPGLQSLFPIPPAPQA